jgi:hypothetical protein
VNFDPLLAIFRSQTVHYGGSAILHFPPSIPFVRGICIICSYDLIARLVPLFERAKLNLTDDLGLAVLIQDECPDAYPAQFVFPEQTLFVPNMHGDIGALRRLMRPEFYICYRFKILEQEGKYNLNDDESRAIDLEQMKQVIAFLEEKII